MKKMTSIYVMDSREVRKHVSGIKIIKENGSGVEFVVGYDTHTTSVLGMYRLLACYLGVVYAEKTGIEKVRLPAKMVWELLELASPLQFEAKVLTESHNKILGYADQLLTAWGIYDDGDRRRKFSVTFDLRDKDIEGFKLQLRLCMHWCL